MKRKPPNARATNAIDRRIAKNILRIRNEKGVVQMDLAERIGVTFQQVQKYEWATNRVAASRLYDIAQALDTPVQDFYAE